MVIAKKFPQVHPLCSIKTLAGFGIDDDAKHGLK
jgi:hypothetical protein